MVFEQTDIKVEIGEIESVLLEGFKVKLVANSKSKLPELGHEGVLMIAKGKNLLAMVRYFKIISFISIYCN